MSFYAFSTENWNRPQDEIDHLMDYLEEFFHKEIDYLDSVGTCIRVSGDFADPSPHPRDLLRRDQPDQEQYELGHQCLFELRGAR
jgi:undecaprenyl diphosphate synthase